MTQLTFVLFFLNINGSLVHLSTLIATFHLLALLQRPLNS